ncbi:MAG: ISL3 family transposase [Dehalococcoidia bacterium]|nr:MAG: ISL3 family transposase [Dehalococcoidia bacterium]
MQDDCIAVALGLPQLKILGQKEMESHFEVTVIYRRGEARCPRCGKVTVKEHDRRQQCKQDRRLRDKTVLLTLIKRRFRCLFCGKVFTEPDEVFGPRRRSSHRFREYLGQEALHQTVRRTAQKEIVGEGLVRRCVAEEIGKRLEAKGVKETPKFIGLDEFSVRGRRLYHTAICNLVEGEVMEEVEGQGQHRVEEYLDKLPQPERVKGVAMDMHEPFRQAVQMCLPQAKIVADKFHLIRHINSALDKVRSRLQGGSRKGKRKDLFKNRYILLKGAERLAHWEKERLNQLFYRYPELKGAWVLKESFRAWYRETDRSKAEEMLGLLEEKIASDSLYEFKEFLHTFTNWRGEILNYFEYRIINGFVEGKNNRIKTIKRMAYGYRNMDNFRMRILATNPGYEGRVSHLLT